MKNIKLPVVIYFVCACFISVSAQQSQAIKVDTLNAEMKAIAAPESQRGWITFKNAAAINPATVFTRFKQAFELRGNDKMVLLKTNKDDLGFTHYSYQQYYKNIQVDGAAYTVHANKSGETYAANGKILTRININTVPVVTARQSIDAALKYVNAKQYKWQSAFWEKDLKERTGNRDTSFYPSPQLIIKQQTNTSQNAGMPGARYVLAYRLDVYSSSPDYAQRIFVDATTGKILETQPLQAN